jgi:hypothetical protein
MHFKLESAGKAALVGIACWLMSLGSVWAQSRPSNLSALKGEMKVFEAVIDGTMSQTFAPPFGLLEKTKGAYLPGFGLTFSLEVELYPTRAPNPFNAEPLSKAEIAKAQKMERDRLATVKTSVPRLLADHAVSLRNLAGDASVAVVVHLFEMQVRNDNFPDQVVIETKKSDLERFWDKKISYEELVAKMTIVEL